MVAEATLTEDVSQGTHIVKVEATDADDITTPYGRVEYELVTPSDFFSVQQKTGQLVYVFNCILSMLKIDVFVGK